MFLSFIMQNMDQVIPKGLKKISRPRNPHFWDGDTVALKTKVHAAHNKYILMEVLWKIKAHILKQKGSTNLT